MRVSTESSGSGDSASCNVVGDSSTPDRPECWRVEERKGCRGDEETEPRRLGRTRPATFCPDQKDGESRRDRHCRQLDGEGNAYDSSDDHPHSLFPGPGAGPDCECKRYKKKCRGGQVSGDATCVCRVARRDRRYGRAKETAASPANSPPESEDHQAAAQSRYNDQRSQSFSLSPNTDDPRGEGRRSQAAGVKQLCPAVSRGGERRR